MTVTLADIREAREAQRGVVYETPVLPDEVLTRRLGARVFLKAECLQRAGSFKIRGAYNKIRSLSLGELSRGVISPSAGNHAQGVALAARIHGAHAEGEGTNTRGYSTTGCGACFGSGVRQTGRGTRDALAGRVVHVPRRHGLLEHETGRQNR